MYVAEMLEDLRDTYEIPCKKKGISCSIHQGPEQMLVSAKRILHHVSIEIYNNGPAIPPNIMEKIFVPFYSTKPEGSGIGLNLSRQINSNHGGQITVESEEGKGTTFKVKLPVFE